MKRPFAIRRQCWAKRQQQNARTTLINLAKRSVQQLLKDVARADGISKGKSYDFIYCAGLFDYLPDRTCKRLMGLFHQSLVPGGQVVATNVAPVSPNRGSLELILDWHLIYRDAAQVATLARMRVLRPSSGFCAMILASTCSWKRARPMAPDEQRSSGRPNSGRLFGARTGRPGSTPASSPARWCSSHALWGYA